MNHPYTERRRFTFNLRTLLIFMLLLGCLFGWVGLRYRRTLEQQAILRWFNSPQWAIHFGDDASFPSTWDLFFDANYIGRIDEIRYDGQSGDDAPDLWALHELKNLELIYIANTSVGDLTPLTQLKNLRELYLFNTSVTDLTPLEGLKNLQVIGLEDTPVADLTPLAQLKNLRELNLSNTKVSDLTPLARLKNLTFLVVHNTPLDDLDFENLQKVLPNCNIIDN